MNQHRIDRLSRLFAMRSPHRRILEGLGIGAMESARDRATLAAEEAACHAECNATVPPGPALGLCHAQCGIDAALRSAHPADTSLTREEACHRQCNATVPPGPALGACHARCALGGY